MRRPRRRPRLALGNLLLVVAPIAACACGGGGDEGVPSRLAVLSAFPAELAALLERASVDDSVVIGDHTFRLGTLGGVRVVVGMTGIGLVNAETTARAVLDRFNVSGVVVSGVAGSSLRIGDVAVPGTWELRDGIKYGANPRWLELAAEVAAAADVALERCALVPEYSDDPVCLPHEPAVVVGGAGRSMDRNRGQPFPCQPDGGDLYGCDVPPQRSGGGRRSLQRSDAADAQGAAFVDDMETAAIAREAAARGLPFIAFRAVSDGAGDPLDLHFPFQFAAYYHLAARNAATITVAFLERLAAAASGARHDRV